MNWLKRISQVYSIEDVIQGVLTNNYDINWAGEYLKGIGPEVCDALEYDAGIDATAVAKMRMLANAVGCREFEPILPEQPNQFNQPVNVMLRETPVEVV